MVAAVFAKILGIRRGDIRMAVPSLTFLVLAATYVRAVKGSKKREAWNIRSRVQIESNPISSTLSANSSRATSPEGSPAWNCGKLIPNSISVFLAPRLGCFSPPINSSAGADMIFSTSSYISEDLYFDGIKTNDYM
jgi:hypothetical protein